MGSVFKSVVIIVTVLSGTVHSTPNTNVTRVLCNSGIFTAADPFATSLAYVLSDLETETPRRKGHDYFNISPYPNAFAYGHATCGAALSDPDCATCLSSAGKLMFDTCPSRVGARAVLYDCGIRYEQYPFTD